MATRPPKPERPRDELGRPLPWGSKDRLPMEDFDSLPLEENHRLGIEHFNGRRFFPAHEAWEAAWKQSKGTEEEEFFKGLSQMGAGYVHYQRQNPHGAKTLLRRGLRRIRPFGPRRRDIDVEALSAALEAHAEAIDRAHVAGEPMPDIVFPTV